MQKIFKLIIAISWVYADFETLLLFFKQFSSNFDYLEMGIECPKRLEWGEGYAFLSLLNQKWKFFFHKSPILKTNLS